jgi:hypothetical protein
MLTRFLAGENIKMHPPAMDSSYVFFSLTTIGFQKEEEGQGTDSKDANDDVQAGGILNRKW